MPTKREVKAIISSKSLTGKEAARLIIRDLVETDHQRPRILTLAEVKQIRANVSRLTERDVQDFNSWMELYNIVGFTLAQAEVLHLEIRLDLRTAKAMLQPFFADQNVRMVATLIPTCVTEKQWQEAQALQREQKLQELHCLAEVIYERAVCLAGGYDSFEEAEVQERLALLNQASSEITELLARRQLQPQQLQQRADELSSEHAGITSFSGHDDDTWAFFKPEGFSLYLSGRQLYETGLPEWRQWIDEYQPRLYEDSISGNDFGEVAIVAHPSPSNLDERGWYKERWPESFSPLAHWARTANEHGLDMRLAIQKTHQRIRMKLRVFLAFLPILETISDLVGVKLHEDLEQWLATIQEETELYREMLKSSAVKRVSPLMRRYLPKRAQELEELRPELPPFTIDDLKPDPSQIKHLQERMSLALTEEDYYQALRGWLSERCVEIDATEDGLAEEVREVGEGD